MTPQAVRFLEKAQKLLAEAEIMLSVGLTDAAGRTAYLAGFHAAQAFIFERAGRMLKSSQRGSNRVLAFDERRPESRRRATGFSAARIQSQVDRRLRNRPRLGSLPGNGQTNGQRGQTICGAGRRTASKRLGRRPGWEYQSVSAPGLEPSRWRPSRRGRIATAPHSFTRRRCRRPNCRRTTNRRGSPHRPACSDRTGPGRPCPARIRKC